MSKPTIRIIFFGSTSDSVLVLDKLSAVSCQLSAVVTQPPRPVGRSQTVTPTPVEIWAKAKNIPVLSFATNQVKPWLFENEQQVIDTLQPFKPDLLVSACYGQKIPSSSITSTTYGGLNVHPSLLPKWRGADPVPWAILAGDHQTGVTIVTLADKFDKGNIIAQKKVPITFKDTSDPIRTRLFVLGADLLVESLNDYLLLFRHSGLEPESSSRILDSRFRGNDNVNSSSPYARRLTRNDGFIPWDLIKEAMLGKDIPQKIRPILFSLVIGPPAGGWSLVIEKALRALSPWPGLWTLVKVKSEEKRLKILACHVSPDAKFLILDTVQIEGKKPVSFSQFVSAYPHLNSEVTK